jgi:dipeptidyl aminopeptidase/acylaminoacyl peptidase
VLHSEHDLRCPLGHGEDLFAILRVLKRDVELVIFPAEGHNLSRSGSPAHRVMRFETILDWFERKLRDGSAVVAEGAAAVSVET